MNESERRWWSNEVRATYPIQTSYYVSALRDRILPAFDSLESEAEEVGEYHYRTCNREAADSASQQASLYYHSMVALRQSLVNLFAVGLGHLFDQQLYNFASGVPLRDASKVKGGEREYTAHFESDKAACIEAGIAIDKTEAWVCIEELRLVSNVVKHAEGDSSRKLMARRRDLFLAEEGIGILIRSPRVVQPMTGEGIFVDPEDIDMWGRAISRFWIAVSQMLLTQPVGH